MHIMQSRRHFLAGLSAAGAAGLLSARASLADEEPLETTTLRLQRGATICLAPGQIAEELLHAEGFRDIRYVPPLKASQVASGEIDFAFQTAAWVVSHLDSGEPVTALAGVHSGCYELFAHDPIRAISNLKGKKVGIPQERGSSGHLLLASIAAYVGLDPHTDIKWVNNVTGDFMKPFAEGEVDAFLGFPPEPQELRARKVGRGDPQHRHGQAVVAVFLLYRVRQPRVRARSSGRHQALPARHP
jgi:NitT/TauT family transport system substrate-binding protein